MNMKFAPKIMLTTVISVFMSAFIMSAFIMSAFAGSDIPDLSESTENKSANKNMEQKIDELKSSLDRISVTTLKATQDFAKAGAKSMQDSLKTANDSMISLMTTVYELIAPIIKTQTVYKSADGQNYVIPTTSISTREKFDIASFKMVNDQKLKEKCMPATQNQSSK